MSSPQRTVLADMADVPAGESAWRFTVQILSPSDTPPHCAPSCSLLADPCARLHELVQSIEHNGPLPMAARHLHLAVFASSTVSECLTDPPRSTGDGTDGEQLSEDERTHLVGDLARAISVAALTSEEVLELRQFASRVHHRLALLRGVFPEPSALQATSWLSTRAYIASYLEDLVLDPSASVPVSLPSSSSLTPP